jgi:two-component system KDP operon response regulator KdpE
VWGEEYLNEVDYVKLYVWRLRQKIEPDASNPTYIHTERGIGYRFAKLA